MGIANLKTSGRSDFQKTFEQAEWAVFINEVPETVEKNSNLLLFGDGQWLIRKNQIGQFCRKYKTDGIPSLDDGPEPSFKFALPRIPMDILKKQVSFYRDVMKDFSNAEAYSIVLYDKEEERYFLEIPKQRISGASVSYAQDELREKFPSNRYIEVISAHSHNTMGAFFSGVDDADEKGDMLYMVMGQLDKAVPAYKIRANVAGKECCILDLEEIFDVTEDEWTMLSPGWQNYHDPVWMTMLNVSANYQSAHHQSYTNHFSGSGNKPSLTRKYIPNSYTFENGYSFDSFLGLYDEEEDDLDADSIKLRSLAYDLRKNAKNRSPAFALASFFDGLIENGFSAEIYSAIEMSTAGDLLWEPIHVTDDDIFLDELSEREDSYLMELIERVEEE